MIANRLSHRRLASGLVLASALFWTLAPGEARADLMRYQFNGTISPSPSEGINGGTPFTGSFTYDPSEAPVSGAAGAGGTQFGQVMGAGQADGDGLSLTVGGQTVYSQQGGLSINSTPGGTGLTNVAFSSANFSASPTTTMAIVFNGANSQLYPAGMPPSAITLGDFASASIYVGMANGAYSYSGMIQGVTAVPAPEPSTAALLAVAAGTLAWRRRKARA